MSFDALLVHTLEVYRREGRRDRFGQDVSVNPRQHEVGGETLHGSYPCRASRATGGLLMEERMVDVFQQRWMVFTAPGVDVTTVDACRVIDADGNEIVPFSKVIVKKVATGILGAHHLELTLWAQLGSS